MKRNFVQRHAYRLLLALLCCSIQAYASVTWEGNSVSDVVDKNLTIKGNVNLPSGGTKIEAKNQNVTVTLKNNPEVRANSNGSRLYLCANEGRTITVEIKNDNLTFLGSNDGVTPLLIVAGGKGDIQFLMRGGHELALQSTNSRAGVEFYALQNVENGPRILFQRCDATELDVNSQNVQVLIGERSLLSYISTLGITDLQGCVAQITFDPVNPGTGRMILNIQNQGAVIIAGHSVKNKAKTDIKLSDIDRTTAAGHNVIMRVENSVGSSTSSSLLVLNYNSTLSELLQDPFLNLGTREDEIDFKGSFNGVRYGFVLGANGTLQIGTNSYLDYVGLANNECPQISEVPGFEGISVRRLLKPRNASAFIVDGNLNPDSTPGQIVFEDQSAIYFRSGVDRDGDVRGLCDPFPFSVDPVDKTGGAGNTVFDVEGRLNVFGSNDDDVLESKFEVLSLFVDPTGGALFVGGTETIFPLRSFARDVAGAYICYNSANFLINNRMDMFDHTIMHTDQNHKVFEKNCVRSEPTYIGGEIFALLKNEERPFIGFYCSRFNANTSFAVAGVDFRVPTRLNPGAEIGADNISKIVAFGNGNAIDDGTGRQMTFGTQVGATACDGCSLISCDAHIDVIQDVTLPEGPAPLQQLFTEVSSNNDTITEGIVGDISNQFSVNDIYLGCSSNISIGRQGEATGFGALTTPTFKINGNFYSFDTAGGPLREPSTVNITGKGGIFVDQNGVICVGPNILANINTMVTKSGNGVVNLPKSQVHFANEVGVADWQLNLNNEFERVIVDTDECFSDYTIDWITIDKDFEEFSQIDFTDTTCSCPEVTQANVSALPVIRGTINQLQIRGSRIGDPAYVIIDGGSVNELVFLPSTYAGSAATGVVIIRNGGRVGLNSAHKNLDSINAQVTLGVNGVIIIADGPGEVTLNSDVIINNNCPILRGPNFTGGDLFEIFSDESRLINITNTGILDLQSFGVDGALEINGDTRVTLQAGATVLFNGSTLRLGNNAILAFMPFGNAQAFFDAIPLGPIENQFSPTTPTPAADPHNQFAPLIDFGQGVQNTDGFRSKLVGTGTISLIDSARIFIDKNAFVGVETLLNDQCEFPTTNITIDLQNNSLMSLGGDRVLAGGVFQIGNTQDRPTHTVAFTLRIRGNNSRFFMGPQAFLGLGMGIVDMRSPIPNEWYIDNLFNVTNIQFDLMDGKFDASQIFPGNDPNAQLIAIGEGSPPLYTLTQNFNLPDTLILGGGNIVRILQGEPGVSAGALAPIVLDMDDFVVVGQDAMGNDILHPRMRVGILASSPMIDNVNLTDARGTEFFEFVKATTATDVLCPVTRSLGLAAASVPQDLSGTILSSLFLGYIDRGFIGRSSVTDIIDTSGGTPESRLQQADETGSVAVNIDTQQPAPGPVLTATQLQL